MDTKMKAWPEPKPAYLTFYDDEEENRWMLDYERARADAAMQRLRLLYTAVKDHNDACVKQCGEGDKSGEECGYKPYFPRRCPTCPLYEQIYDAEGRELLHLAIGELPKEQET